MRQWLARSVMGSREFRTLWVSLIASVAGDQIFPVAVVVSLLNAGGDATTVGAVLASRWAALVLFGLLGGVWADRLPRRHVMLASQAFLCCVVTVGLSGVTSAWVLGGMVFLAGAAESFFRPAFQACLGSVLTPRQRPAGAALNAVSWRVGAIAGPGLGAFLVSTASVRAAFLAALGVFTLSLCALLRLREPAVVRTPRTTARREIAEGVREVWQRRWIGTVIVVTALQSMLTIAPVHVLLPVLAREDFGGDAFYGTSLALLSVGGLLGGIVSIVWKPRRSGLAGIAGLTVYGLVPLALWLPQTPWIACVCFALAGFGLEVFAVQWVVSLQREVPAERLARVTSLDWIAASALTPLGLVLTGPAGAVLGIAPVLTLAGLAGVVLPLTALLTSGTTYFRSKYRQNHTNAERRVEVVSLASHYDHQ
ncbi:MFS transporter [Streptosporangium carneum]|uniref:MFS transporter n=2 Tax=Streptosporangium carneum TaxID=47481 RepID=A0A9W6I7D8_9ACTN|nr:MFS transporter [Streptosporangium carneum]